LHPGIVSEAQTFRGADGKLTTVSTGWSSLVTSEEEVMFLRVIFELSKAPPTGVA
jgi:hypothetical protein